MDYDREIGSTMQQMTYFLGRRPVSAFGRAFGAIAWWGFFFRNCKLFVYFGCGALFLVPHFLPVGFQLTDTGTDGFPARLFGKQCRSTITNCIMRSIYARVNWPARSDSNLIFRPQFWHRANLHENRTKKIWPPPKYYWDISREEYGDRLQSNPVERLLFLLHQDAILLNKQSVVRIYRRYIFCSRDEKKKKERAHSIRLSLSFYLLSIIYRLYRITTLTQSWFLSFGHHGYYYVVEASTGGGGETT